MADVLSDVRKGLEKRLRELEPHVTEHAQVRQALEALKGAGTETRRRATATVKRATSRDGATPSRRGRPSGTGARAQEALKLVRAQPGITIAELAKRMKIKPNYLYRVLPGLEKAGHVVKRGRGYHAGDSETP